MTELFRHVIALPRGPRIGAGMRGVLVIDDLQWADDDSLELLALLVERIARPLTIVATWTTGAELPDVAAPRSSSGSARAAERDRARRRWPRDARAS